MFGLITPRVYAFIALSTAGVLYFVGLLDSNSVIAGFIRSQASTAARNGLGSALTDFVAEPIALAFSEPVGAVVAGLLWPLALLWLVFFGAVLIFAFVAPGLGDAADTIR